MPQVTGLSFSQTAYSFRNSGFTYQQYDCVGFTNLVRRTCGLTNLYNGTNTLWRNHTLVWQGTIAQMQTQFGGLVQGCYLFRIKPESDPDYNNPPIPPQYYMDGIGNVTHVGIYTNLGLGVMQSGGYGGTGVHDSTLNLNYFTHAALPPDIDYSVNPDPPGIDNPDVLNTFWASPNERMGAWCVNTEAPTQKQIDNANNIRSFFLQRGWSINAICAMLGNMQSESTINPAFIQETNRWRLPASGTDLNLLTNDVMATFYGAYYGGSRGYGVGLVQWDGYSYRNGTPQQKLVAYAIDNNYNWYDGWCQCYRLQGEHDLDSQYHFFNPVTVSGVTYTFTNFVTSTANVRDLALAWQAGYERNAGGIGCRADNAQYWYDFFTGGTAPPPVDPDDPIPPEPGPLPDGEGFIPIWLLIPLMQKRKELYKPWKKL